MQESTQTVRYKNAGTVYYREADGRWIAAFDLPPRDGKRQRRVLTHATEQGVRERLAAELEGVTLKPILSRKEAMDEARKRGTHTTPELVAKWRATSACRYCDVALNAFNRVQDHTVPVTEGGSDAIENIEWICWECNYAKAYRLTFEYSGPTPRPFAPSPLRRKHFEEFVEAGGDPVDRAAVETFGARYFRIR